jgi:hypothetical protein
LGGAARSQWIQPNGLGRGKLLQGVDRAVHFGVERERFSVVLDGQRFVSGAEVSFAEAS